MTDLTFQRRRADFEDMLRRAVCIMDNNRKLQEATPETPARSLARLANEVAVLSSGWLVAAPQVGDDAETSLRLSNALIMRALKVAAHCLQAITDLEGVQGIPFEDLCAAMVDDAEEYFGAHSDEWLDLGVDPCLRAQSLLGALGEVAGCWPISPDWPNPYGVDPEDWQFSTLFRLLFEAICAALAAERGLWQEEEA